MHTLERQQLDRLMTFGIAIALAAVLAVAGLVWNNAARSAANNMLVAHSHEVMSGLDEFRAKLNQAESRQWGYFLTRDPSFMAQRDTAIGEMQAALLSVRQQTSNNRAVQDRLTRLQAAVDERLRLMTATQVMFDERGFRAALPLFEAAQAAMSEVQSIILDAAQEEARRLSQGGAGGGFGIEILWLVIGLLVVFLALFYWRLRWEIRHRVNVEDGLNEMDQPTLIARALHVAILNSTTFSSIATDAQGVIQIFNAGAERMLGYAAADVVDKITPADFSDAQEVIARAAALSAELGTVIAPGFEALVFKASRGIEDIYELTYIRKDGSRLPAMVSVTALRDAQDQVIGYLLIGSDNTARKQVEAEQALLDQRLRNQQFYTRSLIESNIDAIITTDPRGIIGDVNQQMEALTGCTRDELIGAPLKNYFTDPDLATAGITQVLREGKITNYELTARARNGKETVVSFNATTLHDRDRNLIGVFAAARDVTKLKQFEHALKAKNIELETATAAAEKANMAKSDFLSSMSHELRSPLNAVLGFAQLMASAKPPPTAAQTLSLDQILKAGWYLLHLINEILDLSMIEAGKVAMSHESMSLTDVIKDCRAMIEPQAEKRGIRLSFPHFDDQLYIHADRTRVKQVMINLLTNAIKYNRTGGEVIVECALRGDNRVRISFKDTGAGLTPEQVAQLFQPFNRLGQESNSEEGTGIGLVVTKQLVELMGGAVGVESQVGVGSTFWVDLVAASKPVLLSGDLPATRAEAPEARPIQASAQLRTVLYVEDNPANLLLVEELISRRSDLKLLTAIDGYQGVQLARTYLPTVILMDINLPGMSGYGALDVLRSDPATAHIPVLALSANALPRDVARGLKAGFFQYLTKPINVDEFMIALDAALRSATDHVLASADKTV